MAITPSSLSFNYKQGNNLPPSRIINYSILGQINDGWESYISSTSSKNWLSSSNLKATSGEIRINNNVKSLSAGTHRATIEIFYYEEDFEYFIENRDQFIKISIGVVTVTVVVTKSILLGIAPDNLVFNYEFGGNVPNFQTIKVVSENSWQVAENTDWLTLSTSSGAGNGEFQVSVIPSGLNIGTHTTTVTINDGVTTKVLPVSLIVSEIDTGNDFLYITPRIINFGYTKEGILPPAKRIELNASANWSAETSKNWVKLSNTTGPKGVATLDLVLNTNVAPLDIGNHYAIVSVTLGNIVKIINITLVVYAFVKELLEENTLYFSDDDNNIVVSSGRIDTHLLLESIISFQGLEYKFSSAVPFYRGVAKERVGLAIKKIIGKRPFLGIGGVSLFTPYIPAVLDISIKEIELFSETESQNVVLKNIKFVKGRRPLNNWISDNTKEMYVTKNGIIAFSFIKDSSAVTEILITGAKKATYTFSDIPGPLVSVIIPTSSFSLKTGDELVIKVQSTEVKVFIKPEEITNSFVFWENKWGVWDCLNFTGEVSENSAYSSNDFKFRKDHLSTETKVLSVTDKQSFKVNTGWMYSSSEVQTLRDMLKSTNIFLMIDNELTKVKSLTKSLPIPKRNEEKKAFNLIFENVII